MAVAKRAAGWTKSTVRAHKYKSALSFHSRALCFDVTYYGTREWNV